jgi:hypothetical protein
MLLPNITRLEHQGKKDSKRSLHRNYSRLGHNPARLGERFTTQKERTQDHKYCTTYPIRLPLPTIMTYKAVLLFFRRAQESTFLTIILHIIVLLS